MGFNELMRFTLERMYSGTCDVVQYVQTTDPVTKKTLFGEQTVFAMQPCRLSYAAAPVTGDGNAAAVTQEIKLFISPDVSIKSGSKIVVTQNGKTTAYANSGEPRLYPTHQEISLKLWERWA